jgi:ferredoxin-type protein NapG
MWRTHPSAPSAFITSGDSSTMTTRRGFIKTSIQGAAVATSGGMLWSYLVIQNARAEPLALRPPGGLPDADFNALCIKCGRCVVACPYDTLKLAALADSAPMGTPYFDPREIPCYLCHDIPCKAACPTGALSPTLDDVMDSRMGLAFIDTEHCLSWQGLRCEICYRVCPLRDKAIRVETRRRELSRHAMLLPMVLGEGCTGCGICENACPTEIAAIKVLPAELIQGKLGEHFRMGWKQADGATSGPEPGERRTGQMESAPEQGEVPGLDYLNQAEF